MTDTRATKKPKQYPMAGRYIDFVISEEVDKDPVGALYEISKTSPVIHGRNGVYGGIALPNNFLFPDQDQDVYFALSYEAARKVAADNKNFSSEQGYANTLGLTFGKTLMLMDEPEHSRNKALVLPSFSHRMVLEELHNIVGPIITQCLDEIAGNGRAELVAQFTAKFPYLIVAKLFGVPADMHDEAEQVVVDALKMGEDPMAALAAFGKMNELYQRVVDAHRATPSDDMTSTLMETEIDGEKLTDEEIVSFIKQIMAAGLDTTTRQTANLIYLLLENPEQLALLKDNPDLLDNAIWESLRYCAAGGMVPRVAINDTEVCGTIIPAGSGVYGVIHTANFDERMWDDPFKFDITRRKVPLMSFGAGPHACLGANLSQAEMRIAMTGVLSRLKNLRKDEDLWDGAEIRGFQLRSPTRLPVLWDVE